MTVLSDEAILSAIDLGELTASFNRDGKSVFCKFIKDMDKNLRCMDECVGVTPDDELVAFGKLIVSPKEIELGQQGMAVRVRGGIPDQ